MNALDEICFLEQQIHDLSRAQQEYEGRALRARLDIKKLTTALEAATKDRTFHENNVRHVRLVTTIEVNLNEFAKAKKNLRKAQVTYENAKIGVQQAESVIAKCKDEVDGAGRRIAGLRARLAGYGQLLEWPVKNGVAK